MKLSLIELVGWASLVLGTILIILGIVGRARKGSGGMQLSDGMQIRVRRLLSEHERILYWRIREAVPNSIVLANVQFASILGDTQAYKQVSKKLLAALLPIVVLGPESAPKLVVFIRSEDQATEFFRSQVEDKLKAIGLPVVTLDHPFVSKEILLSAMASVEEAALRRGAPGPKSGGMPAPRSVSRPAT